MLTEFLYGFAILIAYYIVCIIFALILRKLVVMPRELFRKFLHLILLCSVFIFVYAYETWWISVLAAVAFVLVVYPILSIAERYLPGYSNLLTERKRGELKVSLVVVFTMFAIIISFCGGLFGDKLLVLACVFAWGLGDAAAALVGKRFGKHFLEGKLIEGRKSVEGTFAMFVVSFVSVLVVLIIRGGLRWFGYIITAVIAAAVSAVVELYMRNGFDTITCPLAAAVVIVPLVHLFAAV